MMKIAVGSLGLGIGFGILLSKFILNQSSNKGESLVEIDPFSKTTSKLQEMEREKSLLNEKIEDLHRKIESYEAREEKLKQENQQLKQTLNKQN